MLPHNPQIPGEANAAPVARMKCVHVTLIGKMLPIVQLYMKPFQRRHCLEIPPRNAMLCYLLESAYLHTFLAVSVHMGTLSAMMLTYYHKYTHYRTAHL